VNAREPALTIAGAGLFGLTVARLCAEELDRRVILFETRDHIGGNAYSYVDQKTNIDVHKYGSHIFHTSNEKVWNFVNRFSKWIPYEHKVYSSSRNEIFSLPINLATIEKFADRNLTPDEAKFWIMNATSSAPSDPKNFEELAISSVGLEIYERLFKGYSIKQWGSPPSKIQSNVFKRLPIRFDYNNNYFSDDFQALPSNGYGEFLETLANHENIEIMTGVKHRGIDQKDGTPLIFTGPIDSYFKHSFGVLPWRTLDFEVTILNRHQIQDYPVLNYPDIDVPWTRIHEYKHFPTERQHKAGLTVVAKEFSRTAEWSDEPYYPIEGELSRATLLKYREVAKQEQDVLFAGRLGSFKYFDMHMAIASAMSYFESWVVPRLK
jgi:UDP-galactopyranose mutase